MRLRRWGCWGQTLPLLPRLLQVRSGRGSASGPPARCILEIARPNPKPVFSVEKFFIHFIDKLLTGKTFCV